MKTLLLLLSITVYGQAQIKESDKADYWKAIADVNQAMVNLNQARSTAEAIFTKLKAACGEAPLVTDAKGHPACGEVKKEKPEAVKK